MNAKELKEKLQAIINRAVFNDRYVEFSITNIYKDGRGIEQERFKVSEPVLVSIDNDSWRGSFADELILRSKREVLILNCASSSVDISITLTVKDPSEGDATIEEFTIRHNGVKYIQI